MAVKHPYPQYARRDASGDVLSFVRGRSFGVFSAIADGRIIAAHAPFVIDRAGEKLYFHLQKNNPLLDAFSSGDEVLLTINGPEAYISPDWYELDHNKVPTWNYTAAHLRGRANILPQDRMRDVLDHLTEHFETQIDSKPAWRAEKMDADYLGRMMRAIFPIEMVIDTIDAIWKIGQDKPADAIVKASAGVREAKIGFGARAMAELMADDAASRQVGER